MIRLAFAFLLVAIATTTTALAVPLPYDSPANRHTAQLPALVRVSLKTSIGTIIIALDMKHAPITARNFLSYVEEKRFDNTSFYRAAKARTRPGYGFIQGGIDHAVRRALAPIAHEPTDRTGILHTDGTISMARNDPGTAMGDFFIIVGGASYLDASRSAKGYYPGYAAFGHVVGGMDVVRKILDAPVIPRAGYGSTKGQMIRAPIRIISAQRVK